MVAVLQVEVGQVSPATVEKIRQLEQVGLSHTYDRVPRWPAATSRFDWGGYHPITAQVMVQMKQHLRDAVGAAMSLAPRVAALEQPTVAALEPRLEALEPRLEALEPRLEALEVQSAP
jgi:hypothetical protein